jgi:type IV secretion system protein VirD4
MSIIPQSSTGRAALLGGTALAAAGIATCVASNAFVRFMGLGDAYPMPTTEWWTYALNTPPDWPAQVQRSIRMWLAISGAAGLFSVALPAVIATRCGIIPINMAKRLHGESHWTNNAEAKKAGLQFTRRPPSDAFILGRTDGFFGFGSRYVSLPGQEHVSLYARTRSGKGVSVVVPNCLAWGGSLLSFSIKRDLVTAAAAERLRKGQDVFVFDPTNPDGRSHRWNPLANVPRGHPGCYDAVQRVMQCLVPETKAQNPYWDNAGRRIATAAAVLLAETPGAPLNVAAVKRLVGRPDYGPNFRKIIADARTRGQPYPAAAVDAIIGWLDRENDPGAAGVRDTLMTALQLWDSEVIAAATEVSDFNLAEMRQQPMSVFVCAEVADIRRLRPLFSLFFQQLIDFNTRREFNEDSRNRYQLAVIMDEFWAPGRMDVLADAAAFTASFGFRILYVVQSKQQLYTIYGQEGAENIFLNTGAELLFGGADQRLAEEVSKRGGTDTVATVTTHRPRFFSWLHPSKQHDNTAPQGRSLLLPQEVQRLPKDRMIVLRPTLAPLKLKRIVYYADPAFRDHAGRMPTVPTLHLLVERDPAPPPPTAEEAEAAAAAVREAEHQIKAEKAADVRRQVDDAARHAAEARETEQQTADEARRKVAHAATVAEKARLARSAVTDAAKAARAADADDAARERAAATTAEAERLAADAADATEVARAAKAAASAAARNARSAEKRAGALARAVAAAGFAEEEVA